jgi:hypothetical protein
MAKVATSVELLFYTWTKFEGAGASMNRAIFLKRWIGIWLLLFATIACSKTKPKPMRHEDPKPVAPDIAQFDGGSYCVQTIPQGPSVTRAMHFSNKKSESDGSSADFESDLSADRFDVTLHQRHRATGADQASSTPAINDGPIHMPAMTTTIADGYADLVQTSHYTRSDQHEWAMGTTVVVQGGTPWGLFINKPTVTRLGSETISGFETDKYSVDTTRQTQMDKAALLMAGQLKDYNIVGTAWVAKQPACILQYQIDYEEDGKDGSVHKVHYEGGFTR